LDLARATNMRLTFAPLRADSHRCGRRTDAVFAFEGENGLYQVASNSAALPELLLKPPGRVSGDSWSSDGKFSFNTEAGPKTSLCGRCRSLTKGSQRRLSKVPSTFAGGGFPPTPRGSRTSQTRTGRDEIYVQTFPAGGGKWLVSGNGGYASGMAR
jgi:hypothetical protein